MTGGFELRSRCLRPSGVVRHDSGSGVVWVLALTTVVLLVAAALLGLVQARVERLRASAAADLAALAAAAQLPDTVSACARAREVTAAHGATLVGCEASGLWVEVVVERAWSGAFVGWPGVRVRARAGPPGAR